MNNLPTPTPRPSCISTTATAPDVISSAGTPTAPLQGQVSTYNGLTFMVVDITGASTVTLPYTGYLWPPSTSPSIQRPAGTPSLNWGGNEIIAYLGVIPWIDPNIKWVQLVWPINGASSVLIGFMDARTGSKSASASAYGNLWTTLGAESCFRCWFNT